jgi:hypothetical protein
MAVGLPSSQAVLAVSVAGTGRAPIKRVVKMPLDEVMVLALA